VRESISDDWDGSESWNTEKEETIGELIRLAEEIAERWGENLINTPEAQYLDIDTPSKYDGSSLLELTILTVLDHTQRR